MPPNGCAYVTAATASAKPATAPATTACVLFIVRLQWVVNESVRGEIPFHDPPFATVMISTPPCKPIMSRPGLLVAQCDKAPIDTLRYFSLARLAWNHPRIAPWTPPITS